MLKCRGEVLCNRSAVILGSIQILLEMIFWMDICVLCC